MAKAFDSGRIEGSDSARQGRKGRRGCTCIPSARCGRAKAAPVLDFLAYSSLRCDL